MTASGARSSESHHEGSDAVADAEAMAQTHLARTDEVERTAALVRWLDDAVRIPGTRFGIGLDALVGFFAPVIGDVITGLVALKVMLTAARRGVPRIVLARMLLNVGVDVIGGIVPIVGDTFDLLWRANVRNLELLERHQGELEARARTSDYVIVGGALVAVVASVAAPVVALWWLVGLIFG
ncbi:MAG: DUF4112 domain-containing protein [Myxococcota bacterium]